ncbi:MAG: DUF1573 domain-containing protein [Bacteroidaceae bacterium]|nr:DUF1573 domain-containing protein [Bacteroidaceae bacterium]
MKRFATSIIAAIITITLAAQAPKSPIQFDSNEHNFGKIEEKDGIVKHTFYFMNTSSQNATISNILTSCGCTTVSYSTESIAPGETGELTVSFNPAGTEGEVIRELEVFTNQGRSIDRLLLMADVIPTPLGLEERYPRALAEPIRTETLQSNFGFIEQGKSESKSIILANIGTEIAKIRVVNSNENSLLTIEAPTAVKPQEVESVNVTYTIPATGEYYGTLRDTLWIYSNEVRSKNPIIVTSICTDQFDENSEEPAPSIRIEPSLVDLGIKPAGRVARGTFLIENTGKADLIIRDVETLNRCVCNLNNGTVIKPGEDHLVTVTLPAPEESGKTVMASVNITSNDPVRPFREIRIKLQSK